MFIIATVLSFVASFLVYTTLLSTNNDSYDVLRAKAEVVNMRIYNQAAGTFVDANPTFSGVIPEGSVYPQLPSSYQKLSQWSSMAVAGTPRMEITYGSTTLGGGITDVSELVEATKKSRLVGFKQPNSTSLWSPLYGEMAAISLPASIPDNSLIIVSYH